MSPNYPNHYPNNYNKVIFFVLKNYSYYSLLCYCEAQGKGRAKGRLRRSIKGHL